MMNGQLCLIPLLDDPIAERECNDIIQKQLKPGVFHLLPATWITFLTMLLSLVFTSAAYPVAWSKAKLSMLFKKGNSLLTGNYRGIRSESVG